MREVAIEDIPRVAARAKLARVLDVDAADLDLLDEVDVATINALRDRISDRLHAVDAHRFERVVTASKLVPAGLAATIGERWFGSVLCARLLGLVEGERAVRFSSHLSVDFMADITQRADPRAVGDLVHHLPLATMQAIAGTLLARHDALTLSHFVGHLPPEVVAAILAAIDDDAAVVRIAAWVEDLSHLDPVVRLLPEDRLDRLVTAIEREELWREGLHLFAQLASDQVARVAAAFLDREERDLQAVLEAFDRHERWEQGLELLGHLEADAIRTVAHELVALDPAALDRAVEAAAVTGRWEPLVRAGVAVRSLPDGAAEQIAAAVAARPEPELASFQEAATQLGHPDLLDRLLHGPSGADLDPAG